MLIYSDSRGFRGSFPIVAIEPNGRFWYTGRVPGPREWTTLGHGWSLVCPD